MIRAYANFLSGITAYRQSLETIAHNVANLNTAAFKRVELSFQDLFYEQMQNKRLPVANLPEIPRPQAGLGVRAGATVTFFEQGPIVKSGRPLDLAIEGEGFFRIIRGDGSPAYTRRGEFYLDTGGRLVTARGDILDVPFHLRRSRPETIAFSPEGIVTAVNLAGETETLGMLPLYRFANPNGLSKDRSGQFMATEASGAPLAGAPGQGRFGRLLRYSLEGSNADAGLEMMQLIMAQRALQASARGLVTADELQALALQARS